jgi:hypothetical protein
MPNVTILDVMTDPNLFGKQFGGESFAAWRALLGGFYGLPMDEGQAETFKAITGRAETPAQAADELWLPVGRRGGKSRVAALVATFEGAFKDHRDKLAPGEWATIVLIAADRLQARTLLRYIRAMFAHPMLKPMVARETADGLELQHRTVIEVATASFRATRGYTLAAALCDEIAFWQVDGAKPDTEIIGALRPALATLGGKLLAFSSPYAKRGMLWEVYRRHYGKPGRILVAQAPSQTMNPTLPQHVIDDALADDYARASAEYLALFRSDVSTLLDEEVIRGAVRPSPKELPHTQGVTYHAFTDPAGGGADGFTLGIGHREGTTNVVDLVRELHGSPAQIVAEYAPILKGYGVFRVTGDRYAGQWPADEFRKHGVAYETSVLDRSGIYLEFMAQVNSGQVILPPDEKMVRQMIGLERRTGRSGRDTIDHAPNAHDDLANAAAGAVALLAGKSRNTSGRLDLPF